MRNIIFLLIFPFFFTSCKKEKISNSETFNTKITIHYKNEKDKKYVFFQQYDSLPLKDYSIIDAPKYVVEDEKLKTIFKFNIDQPTNLLLGFNEFYIQPDDNFDIDYEVLESKNIFRDSIHINAGFGAIMQQGEFPKSYNWKFIESIDTANSKEKMDAILNINSIIEQANKVVQNIDLEYIPKDKLQNVKNHLQSFYIKNYYIDLILKLKKKLPTMNGELKTYTINRMQNLTVDLNKISKNDKDYKYWVAMKLYYQIILENNFKEKQFLYKNINQEISKYDDITKQYFYLNVAKSISVFPEINIDNFKHIASKITYAPFKTEVKKININATSKNKLRESIQNIKLLDYNLKEVIFEDIFKDTSQKYIYFDFCGSWCMPCLTEIKEYSLSQKFDNSNVIKPIWIFFEDNQNTWLTVIKKYNLKKENCFLVEKEQSNIFRRDFAIDYNWEGEFPHHFIFKSNGEIINPNAPSLISLNLDDL